MKGSLEFLGCVQDDREDTGIWSAARGFYSLLGR